MPIKYTRPQLIALIAHASALGFADEEERLTKKLEELNNKEKN